MHRHWIGAWMGIVVALCSPLRAVDRSWINSAGGAYNLAGNWNSGVPQAADNGIFNLSTTGYTVNFNAGTTSGGAIVRNDLVSFNMSGFTLTLSGPTGLQLGDQANNGARLAVINGSLSATGGAIASGANSIGIATITTGGTVSFSAPLGIGVGNNAAGQAAIVGGGQLLTTSGVSLGASGSTGTIFIAGVGSNWVSSVATPIIGNGGNGVVSLNSSGTMSSAGVVLGVNGGTGTLSVSGSTSSANFSGLSLIGSSGNGRVTTSGSVSGPGFILGDSAGGVGTFSVSVLGSLSSTGSFVVANAGTGVATFGSNVSSTAGLTIGSMPGSNGTTTIVGAILNNTDSVVVGASGTGMLAINPGGNLSSGSASVGRNFGGAGMVEIAGGTWSNTGSISIGSTGSGIVTISAGGELSGGGIRLGESAAGTGWLNLSGSGSELIGSGSLIVGDAGAGTMNVASAADVSSAGGFIGRLVGGTGVVTVQGTGSSWMNSGSLVVGGLGAGELQVLSGGAVTAASTNVGQDAGSIGTIALSGGATSFTSDGGLFVGGGPLVGGGSGIVCIGAGATVTVGSGSLTRVYPSGSINLDGGTLSTGSLQVQIGGALNFNSGTLHTTGPDGFTISNGAPLGGNVNLTTGKNLNVSGAATISPGAIVQMSGGYLRGGEVINEGELLLSDRTALVDADLVNNSGLITGDGRISGVLINSADGEVRANAGQRITFLNGLGSSANAGQINLFGGTVELDGLTNSASGRITGRGTLVTHLTNNGSVMFSAGVSDVLRSIINTSGSKVIVTGGSTSTFFDAVTNQAGSEFRVSTGATAVFLGSVNGLSQFTGSGTRIFEGPASFGDLDTSGTTIVGPAGSLTATRVRENALLIEGIVTIEPHGTSAATSRVNSLSIEGGSVPVGTFDLNNNALVVDYATGDPSPLPTIRDQIAHAFHAGAWDRPGITSSMANSSQFGIGYAEAAVLSTIPAVFGSVDSSAVLVRFTRFGDADLNGAVNLDDFNRLAGNFGGSGKDWSDGDFTFDTQVNLDDFNRLAGNFGLSASPGGPTPDDWAALTAAVPEPGVGCIGLTLPLLLNRRRLRD